MKKIVLLFLMISFSLISFAQEKKSAERKIGIVNVNEVLDKYEKKIDQEKEWKQAEKIFNDKLAQKTKEMEKLREEYIKAGDDVDKESLGIELLKAKKEREKFTELTSEIMQREIAKAQLIMIRDIKKTIQDYGEENSFFLILQTQPKNSKSNDIREALAMINLSDVLYYDKNFDITEPIINLLNTRYKLTKPKTSEK